MKVKENLFGRGRRNMGEKRKKKWTVSEYDGKYYV